MCEICYNAQLYDKEIKRKQNVNRCIECNIEVTKKAKRCEPCYMKKMYSNVKRPSMEELKEMIERQGYSATGRECGVSPTTIRRWVGKN